MKKILVLVVILCSGLQYSMAQSDSAAKANQIIILEQKLADALPGDPSVWNKYTAPNWYMVDEDGIGHTKKDFLDDMKPFPPTITGQVLVTNPVLSFYGNIAVIHYVADEHETFFGQKLHTTYGTMDTWYKTDTSWTMLGMQDFEIPAWPPAIQVDAGILTEYAGTYKMAGDRVAVVTVKNDTLFVQKNGGKMDALFAETSNVFFHKSEARGRRLFVKDTDGQILMLERRNGQDVIWRKVK